MGAYALGCAAAPPPGSTQAARAGSASTASARLRSEQGHSNYGVAIGRRPRGRGLVMNSVSTTRLAHSASLCPGVLRCMAGNERVPMPEEI